MNKLQTKKETKRTYHLSIDSDTRLEMDTEVDNKTEKEILKKILIKIEDSGTALVFTKKDTINKLIFLLQEAEKILDGEENND